MWNPLQLGTFGFSAGFYDLARTDGTLIEHGTDEQCIDLEPGLYYARAYATPSMVNYIATYPAGAPYPGFFPHTQLPSAIRIGIGTPGVDAVEMAQHALIAIHRPARLWLISNNRDGRTLIHRFGECPVEFGGGR